MKYSFIIPTYNRIDELKELIPSLQELEFGNSDFEIIIVDDGSTDDTKEYISSLNSKIKIKYRLQANQGPGAARNLGMSIATGKYFLFVDSDCIIPSDYLKKVDAFIQQNNPDAFGGPDTFHPSFSPLLKAINYSMTSFLGTGGTRGSTKSVAKFYPRSFNMGFDHKVYKSIGGFGSLRHGQDMDYSARIFDAGFKVSLIPDAFVYHKRRTSLKKFYKQIYNWGIARINLAQIHKGFLKPVHLLPAILLIGSFAVIILVILGLLRYEALVLLLILATLTSIVAFYQSFKMYRSVKISLLSVVTLFTQVIAYGSGSVSGLFQRYVLGKKESRGFTRNYYK